VENPTIIGSSVVVTKNKKTKKQKKPKKIIIIIIIIIKQKSLLKAFSCNRGITWDKKEKTGKDKKCL
jgi:hypothetical protein